MAYSFLRFFVVLVPLYAVSPNCFTDGTGPLFTLYILSLVPSSPPLHLSTFFSVCRVYLFCTRMTSSLLVCIWDNAQTN